MIGEMIMMTSCKNVDVVRTGTEVLSCKCIC